MIATREAATGANRRTDRFCQSARLSLALLVALGIAVGARAQSAPADAERESARAALRAAAASYKPIADRIIAAALAQDEAYAKLEQLCDDVGHRLSGSPGLERAIEWALATMKADGHENVRAQPVMAPKWVRGRESLRMLSPTERPLPMLGLGGSVGTPPEGITAAVVSVSGLEELDALGDKVAGKIVLFDVPMSEENAAEGGGYGTAVRYRGAGARYAVKHGAVAVLVRSVTTRSLQSPHTGAMSYLDAIKRIPAAAISVEDAAKITRLQRRGIEVRVKLQMEARTEPDAPSANVLAELRGREKPEEIVVIGGHLDSWDVGQGAHDDGGGCVMAMQALTVLRKLDLRPRRTIRVVLFTNEENGLAGGRAYASEFANELPRHVAAVEADAGTFAFRGYSIDLENDELETHAAATLTAIHDLLAVIEPAPQIRRGWSGADIGPMRPAGVPLLGQRVDMTHYFDYHHTHADTFDKVAKADLDENVAAMAVLAYVLADMPGTLRE